MAEAKLYRTKKPTGMKGKVEEHVTVGLDANTYRVISRTAKELGLSLSEYGRACMVLVTPGLNASLIKESFPNLGCATKEKIF